ncbi:MAG: hypothetical protein AB7O97_08045 [Planctomycetota bacterium]
MRFLPTLLSAPLLAALLPAQQTLLMIADSDERTIGLDAPEIDLIRSDEIYEVTPLPGGAYTARPFLPISLQYSYLGDTDNDAQYVEDSVDGPGGTLDVVFVKAGTTGPVTPRDVYFSIDSVTSINIPGLGLSDVIRYAAPGVLDTFVTETELAVATGGTSLNLDALCQSPTGDLFLSFALTETLWFGSADDGDLIMIPASAITYDPVTGNVTAMAANSAVLVANQTDLVAMVNASGFRSSVGGTVTTTSFELSGLEMDPNGGFFIAPQDPLLVVPNVLFCWSDFSSDGGILSTANGGSFALINGVPMASAIATQGDQIGWLPDSTGTNGPGGIALIPIQAPSYAMLNYPRNLHTQGTGQTMLQLQVSGGTPNGLSILAVSVETSIAGGGFGGLPSIPGVGGELFLSNPFVLGLYPHDALGNTQSQLLILATPPLSGLNMATQSLDLATFQLSTPGALSFL